MVSTGLFSLPPAAPHSGGTITGHKNLHGDLLWFGGCGYQHVVVQGRGYFSSGNWVDGTKVEYPW